MYRIWTDKFDVRWAIDQTIVTRSLATPAIRMVAVNVGAYEDGFGVEYRPVLAITSTTYVEWRKRAPGESIPKVPGNAALARREGWEPREQDSYCGYVVMGTQYDEHWPDVIDPENMETAYNVVERLVAAPWPEAEDEARLKLVVEDLKKELVKKMERNA